MIYQEFLILTGISDHLWSIHDNRNNLHEKENGKNWVLQVVLQSLEKFSLPTSRSKNR